MAQPDWSDAQADADACDVFVVIGTSGLVLPAAGLPHRAASHGSKVIHIDPHEVGLCDAWLRGPLREWAESLLDERRLRTEGLFRSEPIAARWREHLDGRRDHTYSLWSVLMVQAWLDREQTQVVA